MKTDIRKKTSKIEDQIRELEEKRISLMIKEADDVLEKLLKEHSSVTVRLVKNPHESEEIAFEPTPGIRFKQDGHTFRFTRFGLVNKIINAKVQEIVTIDGEDCFLQESDWSPLYLLKKDEDVDRTSLHLDLTIQWLADSEYAWENNAYVPNFMDENNCDPFDLPYEAFPASANTASDNLEEDDFENEDETDALEETITDIRVDCDGNTTNHTTDTTEMTEQEITDRIADLNSQITTLKEERDELVWTEGIPAIIAKMKSLGKDTICLRDADYEENYFRVTEIWGNFDGGNYAANRLRLDEYDNLILAYNDVTDYGESWEYGDEDYESVVTKEISNEIIAPNLDVILNEITDFYKLYRLPQDTSEMVDMQEMFKGREELQSLDLSHFDTSKVTNMRLMFDECYNLQCIDLSSFDTSNVIDMCGMFAECYKLQTLDVCGFDTSKVTDMSSLFYRCRNLQSLDLNQLNTSNVTDMCGMFADCSSLQSLNLSSFDSSNVTDMRGMFSGCSSLQELDLSNFDMSNVGQMDNMFDGCCSLKTVIMKNCSDETVEKIKAELPEGVEIIR